MGICKVSLYQIYPSLFHFKVKTQSVAGFSLYIQYIVWITVNQTALLIVCGLIKRKTARLGLMISRRTFVYIQLTEMCIIKTISVVELSRVFLSTQTGKLASTAMAEFFTWTTSAGPQPGRDQATAASVTTASPAQDPPSRWNNSTGGQIQSRKRE